MSHKSAGADEYHSPTKLESEKLENSNSRVRIVNTTKTEEDVSSKNVNSKNVNVEDILVVVSKLKNFVKDSSGMNTAGDVMPVLSDIIRKTCSAAVENAEKDGRRTLMARDFK
jgi:hypothetical protein